MTEAEWLSATDPTPMFQILFRLHERGPGDRKLRHFHVACCERVEPLLIDPRSRKALAFAQRHADGQAAVNELNDATAAARDGWRFSVRQAGAGRFGATFDRERRLLPTTHGPGAEVLRFDPSANAAVAVWGAVEWPNLVGRLRPAEYAARAVELENDAEAGADERRAQAQLLRCVVGNPFRPVTLDPRWQSETVVALATGIYTERAFDRLPILADALEEAGCDDADVLAHCRGDELHVRGCWVVDVLLGKE